MRTLSSLLFGVLAVLMTALASSASWLSRHIVDRDGFAAIAGPLVQDGEVKDHMTSLASQQASSQIVSSVPFLSSFQDRIDSAIKGALDTIVATDAYGPAASESLMTVHDSAFGPEHTASLSLKPLTKLVMDSVSSPLGFGSTGGVEAQVPLGAPSLFGVNFFKAVQDFSTSWPVFLILAILCGLLSVLGARRRGRALAIIGGGILLVGVLFLITGSQAGAFAAGLSPDPFGAILFRKIGDLSAPSLSREAMWVVYAGIGVMLLGFVVGLSAKDRRHSFITA